MDRLQLHHFLLLRLRSRVDRRVRRRDRASECKPDFCGLRRRQLCLRAFRSAILDRHLHLVPPSRLRQPRRSFLLLSSLPHFHFLLLGKVLLRLLPLRCRIRVRLRLLPHSRTRDHSKRNKKK